MQHTLRLSLLIAIIGLTSACSDGKRSSGGGAADTNNPVVIEPANLQAAQCIKASPYLQVGVGIDAPSQTLAITPQTVGATLGSAGGACANNQDYQFGAGIHDITGPVANTSGMGWESPTQVFNGIHTRLHSRAFSIASPCNGKRIAFVSADIGVMTGAIRTGVLAAIANDPDLAPHYGPDNVMLSVTHTHNGPAGYSHYEALNIFHFGLDEQNLNLIIDGIFASIKEAHDNLEAQPETARIGLAIGELLNTNINRSVPAFDKNSEAERMEFLDTNGEIVDNDKRVVQLNLIRENGSAVGIINWFGVHPTIAGPETTLVSSDHKGYASQVLERVMRKDNANGEDFVAAFAQKDEGDASPNIFIVERPHPDPTRGGGTEPYNSVAIAGTKQVAKALELLADSAAISGPIDYRLFHVQMDQVTVTDPVVLNSLEHPAELDAAEKRTCLGALGVSMGAGAEDGPGFTNEGVSCNDDPDVIQAASDDVMTGFSGKIPPYLLSTAVLCNIEQQPLLDLSCHAEKPILFVLGAPLNLEPSILPFQLMRIGNVAVLGIPWEVTTIAARRIQKILFPILAPAGVDTIVVAGLVNEYVHYLTTREEYSAQHYEGGSTVFGPWSLAAVQQESRKLAQSMVNREPAPEGPDYVDGTPLLRRLPYIPSDLPDFSAGFGDVVSDAPASANPGDTVTASFQSGHPRNNLNTEASYVYVDKQNANGEWEVVYTDSDPELRYQWHPLIPSPLPNEVPEAGPSTADAIWQIPLNITSGTYRLRHVGAAQTLILPLENFEATSSPFLVQGDLQDCP